MATKIDLDPSMRLNSNKGIFIKTGDDAVVQQIRDIIFTQKGEKLFQPDTGCNIGDFLHGSVNRLNAMSIKDIIYDNINNQVEDIIITESDIIVNTDRDAGAYNITIKYRENELQEETELNFSISVFR